MKQIISIILVSIYLSITPAITAQIPNLTGNWITGWQVNPSSCCVSSEITITPLNNTNILQAAFTFPSNYTFNEFSCKFYKITGNFITNFTFYDMGNFSIWAGFPFLMNNNIWDNDDMNYPQMLLVSGSNNLSLENSFGPFVGVNFYNCYYAMIPLSSSSNSLEAYVSNFIGNYGPIISVNSTANQLFNTCCIPNSVSIEFIENTGYFNITTKFSQDQESLSNTWCNGEYFDLSQSYKISTYTTNLTWWTALYSPFQFVMDINSPGYITVFFTYDISDPNITCTFNMSVTNFTKFAKKFAINWVFSIIMSLLIIS